MRWLFALLIALLSAGAAQGAEFDRRTGPLYSFEWRPGLEGFAESLRETAEAHHDRIYGALGLSGAAASGPATVVLLWDEDEMREVATAQQGGRPPEWAEGLAYPGTRHIYLHVGVGPRELAVTLQHEIAHLAVGEMALRRVPRWFNEGLAIQLSEGFAMDRAWLLTEAATMDALHSLRDLNRGFPASGARAGVAYAQAVHFVGFLQARAGPDRFVEILRLLREEDISFDDAVEKALGEPLHRVEREWQEGLKVRWGWLPVIFGSTGMWVLGALALVLAWRRRSRQKSARLTVMAREEAADMAEEIELAHELTSPRPLVDPYDGRPPTIH